MAKFIFCIMLMCVSAAESYAQSRPDSNFYLYLLAGQSNMAGRGIISDEYKAEGNANVYMLDKNNEWVLAKHPLHFDKPKVAGVGPGLAFGIKMAEANPGKKIGLVPCAVGGTSINKWKLSAYDSATKTHPYDDAMKRIEIAMQRGVFKGIIWHQGESDSSPEKADTYLPKLITLIKQFRDKIQNNKLPFVAGELGTYKSVYSNINHAIAQLPQQVSFTAIASSNGLTSNADTIHFNAASAEELGKRYAEKMKQL